MAERLSSVTSNRSYYISARLDKRNCYFFVVVRGSPKSLLVNKSSVRLVCYGLDLGLDYGGRRYLVFVVYDNSLSF